MEVMEGGEASEPRCTVSDRGNGCSRTDGEATTADGKAQLQPRGLCVDIVTEEGGGVTENSRECRYYSCVPLP